MNYEPDYPPKYIKAENVYDIQIQDLQARVLQLEKANLKT